jgi:hypothetical protein
MPLIDSNQTYNYRIKPPKVLELPEKVFSELLPPALRIENTAGSALTSEHPFFNPKYLERDVSFEPSFKGYESYILEFLYVNNAGQEQALKRNIDREHSDLSCLGREIHKFPLIDSKNVIRSHGTNMGNQPISFNEYVGLLYLVVFLLELGFYTYKKSYQIFDALALGMRKIKVYLSSFSFIKKICLVSIASWELCLFSYNLLLQKHSSFPDWYWILVPAILLYVIFHMAQWVFSARKG